MTEKDTVTNLAEKGPRLKINDILRAPFVTAVGSVQTVRPFNLAERAFSVCMVARDIARRIGHDDTRLMKYALDKDLDAMFTGGTSFDSHSTHGYRGKSREPSRETPLSSRECAIVELASTMVDIGFLNVQGLGRHAADTVDQLIDTLNNRVGLFSSSYPELSDAVGATIAEMDLGNYISES